MKRILLIFGFILAAAAGLRAQDFTAPMDSTLLGKDIFSLFGEGIRVQQTPAIRQAVFKYVQANGEKPLSGFRIRVYYDNSPQARTRSESIEKSLKEQYPELEVYRGFESPNYKVFIGDFRSKDEALRVFNALKKTYPTAYIIKETINYPR